MIDLVPFAEREIEGTIAARFQRVVTHCPDQVAIVADEGTFTYRSIDTASTRVASALTRRALRTTGPIAILLPQGVQVIVALLGALKAGHSFVLLPPTFPPARLQAIWADAGSPALLTTQQYWAQAVALTSYAEECLDLEQLVGEEEGDPVPTTSIESQELAALFYTTGTTGEPKGVMWSQLLVLHTARQNQALYALAPEDRVAILTSYGFGAAMTLCFAALLNGATLCLVDHYLTDMEALLGELQQQAVTVWGLPSVGLLRQLMTSLVDGRATPKLQLPNLRLILLGGQPLHRQDAEHFYCCFGEGVELRYRLAGSETMLMCDLKLDPQTEYSGDAVPVGYVVPDKELLLLDEDRAPVPLGEIGEIAIRSRYLASGYWQQPALTAATFLADPDDAQRRICLTGDMGCLTSEGLLQHWGRKDNMVKVRGYRVQLEAIETTLNSLASIAEAVVIARETSSGEKQLVAYYTTTVSPPPTTSDLRNALLTHLPDFMIPARFVRLETLPRNATGKLDRTGLPQPGVTRPDLETPFVAPRNELEAQIADIWAEELALDEVGIDDNFFELGGDSIAAMRLFLKLKQTYEQQVSATFFHIPTIANLVKLIATGAIEDRGSIDHHASFTQSHCATKHTRSRTLQSLTHYAISRGPYWRDHTLPYGIGVRLQRHWLRLPFVRKRLEQQCVILQAWPALMGDAASVARLQELSILANTWRNWRARSLRQPRTFARWVSLQGIDILERTLATERPIILVGAHTGFWNVAVWQVIRRHTKRPSWTLGYSPEGHVAAVAKTVNARELLLQSGIVWIAGDGAQGTRGVEFCIGGHPWLFRSGGAELAVETNAIMLPVFNTLEHSGRIRVTFLEPLATNAQSHPQQVAQLTGQYAALLQTHWPMLLGNMSWQKLHQIIAYCNRKLPASSAAYVNFA